MRLALVTALTAATALAQGTSPTAPPASPPAGIWEGIIGDTATRLAVPDCVARAGDQSATEACRTISEVLRKDLLFEDLTLVSESLYKMLPPLKPDAPNFEDWKSVGAQVLVITKAEVAAGVLNLELRLHNVTTGQSMMAKRLSNKAESARHVAHHAADEILALAQIRGVARSKLAFVSDRDAAKGKATKEIYIMDYDGANPRRVTVNRSINMLPAWNPDGKSLAYISYRSGWPELFTAWIYEGRNTAFAAGKSGKVYAHAFSPDGKKVAYGFSPASGRSSGDMDIWVANSDGTQPQRLTETAASDTAPTWSPTGREIAFTRSLVIGQPQIWVMDSEGLNARRVSTIGNYNDGPAWNPAKEFTEIAYTSRVDNRFEVVVVDLANGQTRQITQGRGHCESPAWAPNGRHLVFGCDRGGRWQIHTADRLGREIQALPAGAGNNIYPDWGPVANQ
jgi:TolB protein